MAHLIRLNKLLPNISLNHPLSDKFEEKIYNLDTVISIEKCSMTGYSIIFDRWNKCGEIVRETFTEIEKLAR
jgi:hypothetical protein